MKKTYTIHDLPAEDRPRERLKSVGVDNLSVQELLALVIEKGGRGENVLTTAQRLLAEFGNLAGVKEASLEELKAIKGIGEATACKIQATFKIGEKAKAQNQGNGQKIKTPKDVFSLLKDEIGDKKKEHFKLLSLDSRNQLIDVATVSVGTVNSSIAHPREVFKSAIRNSATAVILAHNHPSGSLEVSLEDEKITKRLVKAGELLGIELLDHVIITNSDFVSLMGES